MTLTEYEQIAQDAMQDIDDYCGYRRAKMLYFATFDPPTVLGLLELIRVQHGGLKDARNIMKRDPFQRFPSVDKAIAAHDAMFRATGEDGGK